MWKREGERGKRREREGGKREREGDGEGETYNGRETGERETRGEIMKRRTRKKDRERKIYI